ncbi:MAG: type I-B CRISPR-associated protein Cas7/Csh2 [Calditrichaeota bacterium]|nr:type I-B CRISPR-associated protein Cas7/Csh2 [Calditrichota bacterium]
MAETLTHRHEILFIYDVKDANPNGDPIDENKPRIDEETGVNIVTDVRLKRTIRDYLFDHKNMEVFVREVKKEDGNLKTKEDRLDDLNISSADDLINTCIDIRLFGATAAIKNKTITFTGPVQFKFGRSLHRVKLDYVKGTTVMPSKEARKQGTFTEVYTLPYSLIVFHGIANENAARHTRMTDSDLDLLMEAIWNGTKNLISRSKFGQMPRLLLDIEYQEPNFHIGDLDKMVSIKKEDGIEDEALRDISQLTLNILPLVETLQREKGKIARIRYAVDERLQMAPSISQLPELLDGVSISSFSF